MKSPASRKSAERHNECSTCHRAANPAHYCDRHAGGPWCDECWKVGDCTDLHGEGCHTMAWDAMDPAFSDGLDRAFLTDDN